jgi:hypothetical protein
MEPYVRTLAERIQAHIDAAMQRSRVPVQNI